METEGTLAIRIQRPSGMGHAGRAEEAAKMATEFMAEMVKYAEEMWKLNPRFADLDMTLKCWGDGVPRK